MTSGASTVAPGTLRARRVIVKVGSSLVTNDGRGLDSAAIANWSQQVARLKELAKRQGGAPLELVLVSSGAVAEGLRRLGWVRRPHEMHDLQAAAAIGQMGLIQAYESAFRAHGIGTAQILLTHADLSDRKRYLNGALGPAAAAVARHRSDRERERHRRDRRNQVRG